MGCNENYLELLGESDEVVVTQHLPGLDLRVGFGFWKDLGAARAAWVEAWLRRVHSTDSAMLPTWRDCSLLMVLPAVDSMTQQFLIR